ncbi:YggS family pyridoxal phosphate-dependent enzyme [Rothia aerolata]|uniref:Pyridoxal phosphate homeostasis protein n=1 Tax=Rothia aerolata TaxID=1812262 RepID=A0A917IJM8_9MICC|nr:YggS family pyridoxal phosphate-dependent enzyme [Rothia aerolata]GGH56503.1 YggS family pyridoxal phosphate enzyme [Rothia aerolata]
MEYSTQRYQELSENLKAIQRKIAEAATDLSGVRTTDSPQPKLTVVTKFFPASDVAALYDAGVRRVGENRDQEAASKAQELTEHVAGREPLRWSYIGQLQTNKAKSVVKYAADVHSVDRASLVKALGKAYANQLARFEAGEAQAPAAYELGGLQCLIQVNLDDDVAPGHAAQGARGGASEEEVLALAELLENTEGLSCGGVMAVAPLGADADQAFEKLYGISQKLQADYPHAREISAGMSGDLAAAIRWGSTNVRVGSQIMGSRPLVN